MTGTLSYFEIPVADADRGRAFYGGLFGWRFQPGNLPGYSMIDGSTPLGGLSGGEPGGAPRVFFTVPDVDAGAERVRALGGEADDPVTVPSGRFARCRDDQGTPFTLWQDAPGVPVRDAR